MCVCVPCICVYSVYLMCTRGVLHVSVYLDSVCHLIFVHNIILQFDKFFTDLQTNQLRGGAEHITLKTHTHRVSQDKDRSMDSGGLRFY